MTSRLNGMIYALTYIGGEIEMSNSYEKLLNDISKNLTKLGEMIVWLAERTLSVKDYKEFADRFSEKKSDDNKKILIEMLKNKEYGN